MKSSNVLIFALIFVLMTGCGGGGGGGSPATKTLVSLALSPINPSISKGAVQQFTATGTYSDKSTQDLTTGVLSGVISTGAFPSSSDELSLSGTRARRPA